MGLDVRKPVFRVCKQLDLISAFVIRFLENVISKLAKDTSEISIFYLVSVADETGIESRFVENSEDRFCHIEAHMPYLLNLHK